MTSYAFQSSHSCHFVKGTFFSASKIWLTTVPICYIKRYTCVITHLRADLHRHSTLNIPPRVIIKKWRTARPCACSDITSTPRAVASGRPCVFTLMTLTSRRLPGFIKFKGMRCQHLRSASGKRPLSLHHVHLRVPFHHPARARTPDSSPQQEHLSSTQAFEKLWGRKWINTIPLPQLFLNKAPIRSVGPSGCPSILKRGGTLCQRTPTGGTHLGEVKGWQGPSGLFQVYLPESKERTFSHDPSRRQTRQNRFVKSLKKKYEDGDDITDAVSPIWMHFSCGRNTMRWVCGGESSRGVFQGAADARVKVSGEAGGCCRLAGSGGGWLSGNSLN